MPGDYPAQGLLDEAHNNGSQKMIGMDSIGWLFGPVSQTVMTQLLVKHINVRLVDSLVQMLRTLGPGRQSFRYYG